MEGAWTLELESLGVVLTYWHMSKLTSPFDL